MSEIERLLTEQNNLLRQLLLQSGGGQKLGFSDRIPGSKKRVFIGRNGESCLYTLDKDRNQIPLTAKTLTGYLVGFVKAQEMRRGKDVDKLNITIRTDDEIFVVSGGFDTCYAQSFLSAVSCMDASQFAAPISLVFTPGEDQGGKIVWCGVYAPVAVITPPYDRHADIDKLLAQAEAVFESGNTAKLNQSPVKEGREGAGQSKANVVIFPEGGERNQKNCLYPEHNSFIKKLMSITGHDKTWVLSQCRVLRAQQPGDLNPDNLRVLITAMAADYGWSSGVYHSPEGAVSAFEAKVATYQASGQKWGQGAIAWLESIKAKVS